MYNQLALGVLKKDGQREFVHLFYNKMCELHLVLQMAHLMLIRDNASFLFRRYTRNINAPHIWYCYKYQTILCLIILMEANFRLILLKYISIVDSVTPDVCFLSVLKHSHIQMFMGSEVSFQGHKFSDSQLPTV